MYFTVLVIYQLFILFMYKKKHFYPYNIILQYISINKKSAYLYVHKKNIIEIYKKQ